MPLPDPPPPDLDGEGVGFLTGPPPYVPPSPEHSVWLGEAKAALASADDHIKSATLLAAGDRHRHGTGHLVLAIEEAQKAGVYYLAYLDIVTFDPAKAAGKRYFCPDWLHSHSKKQSLAGLTTAADYFRAGFFAAFIGWGPAAAVAGVVTAAYVWTASQELENLKQRAFYSGEPRGSPPPGDLPTVADYDGAMTLATEVVKKWRKRLDSAADPVSTESEILPLAQWRKVTETGTIPGLTESFQQLLGSIQLGQRRPAP